MRAVIQRVRHSDVRVAEEQVALVNDGPVTFVLDSTG
jgi:D-Tyr-tRNAtyr deacylase